MSKEEDTKQEGGTEKWEGKKLNQAEDMGRQSHVTEGCSLNM